MSADVIVIGGGVEGLVTATLLAKAGRSVTLLERRPTLGGLRTTEEFHPGFRANLCFDDPGWMPEGLAGALDLRAHGVDLSWAPVGATIVRDDGPPVALTADTVATAAALRPCSARDAERWPDFCRRVEGLSGMLAAIYSAETPQVGASSPRDLATLLTLGRRLRGLGKRGMVEFLRAVPMPIADFLDENFEDDGLKGALALAGVFNVQHGPLSGGTTLVFLHQQVGAPRGLFHGRRLVQGSGGGGGIGRLPAALAAAARAAGVTIRTEAPVAGILTRDARTAGVALASGEEIQASCVVSSLDVRATFGHLVDPGDFDPEFLEAVDHVRMRGSAVRIHLALSRLPAFATLGQAWGPEHLGGCLTFAADIARIERAYDAAKHGRVADAPVFRAVIPTLQDPTLAPPGQHVLTVHAQFGAFAPAGGWSGEAESRFVDAVLDQIERHAPDVRACVAATRVLTPARLAEQFGVTEGNLLHGELALDQFLFMRPVPHCARYATPLPGLWLCGGSTHPGAGTAGASGWLAARAIMRSSS